MDARERCAAAAVAVHGHDNIQPAVAIEVADRHTLCLRGLELRLERETPAAIAPVNRGRVLAATREEQVQQAVAIEVRDLGAARAFALGHFETACGCEGARAVAPID